MGWQVSGSQTGLRDCLANTKMARGKQILLIWAAIEKKYFVPLAHLGWDSPTLKLCYLCLWLALFQLKTLLEEKSVIVELGESQPRLWKVILLHKTKKHLKKGCSSSCQSYFCQLYFHHFWFENKTMSSTIFLNFIWFIKVIIYGNNYYKSDMKFCFPENKNL